MYNFLRAGKLAQMPESAWLPISKQPRRSRTFRNRWRLTKLIIPESPISLSWKVSISMSVILEYTTWFALPAILKDKFSQLDSNGWSKRLQCCVGDSSLTQINLCQCRGPRWYQLKNSRKGQCMSLRDSKITVHKLKHNFNDDRWC